MSRPWCMAPIVTPETTSRTFSAMYLDAVDELASATTAHRASTNDAEDARTLERVNLAIDRFETARDRLLRWQDRLAPRVFEE